MSLFKDMLGEGESLFKNEEALDPEWVPKLLPHREAQQHAIASSIKPLLQDRNGRNCFIFGVPGIGKTAATRWVLRDLEENTEDVRSFYVNCWQKNTTYKVFVELCEQLGYRFVQNKNSEDLFKIIKKFVNKIPCVFAFDEVDKVEDLDFLYSILNDVFKKSILLITNYSSWLADVEDRIRSRLLPEQLEFKPYSKEETRAILSQRLEFAFVPDCWSDEALARVIDKAAEAKDIRVGLYLLREAGLAAEDASSRKILPQHAEKALSKLKDFSIKNPEELGQETKLILSLVGDSERIGDLYKRYKAKGGKSAYKTFQRKIEKLNKAGFISVKKIVGGTEGTTTLVEKKTKQLTDF